MFKKKSFYSLLSTCTSMLSINFSATPRVYPSCVGRICSRYTVSNWSETCFVLPTLPELLSSPPVYSRVGVTRSLVLCVCLVDRCLFFWSLCCLFFSIYGFWLPFGIFKLFIYLCSVRLYLQLFEGGLMSCFCYLYLLAYCSIQLILYYVFFFFFFVLSLGFLCCQFRWIVNFWFLLRYSLTFIYTYYATWQKKEMYIL